MIIISGYNVTFPLRSADTFDWRCFDWFQDNTSLLACNVSIWIVPGTWC